MDEVENSSVRSFLNWLQHCYNYAFGEIDARDGGGLEAHPRLTNGTLYRSFGSTMTMKRARKNSDFFGTRRFHHKSECLL